ncbi:unnamed protein product [Orchesella dallaii]|uniref:Uncharacterized protein n=1 Tax=Orchesella dallaii TaxID=48710 RepID=A0ABP1Q9E8_9HEXA
MVFHPEGQFRQFQHCKFRENVVALLQIPAILHNGNGGKSKTNIIEDDQPTDYLLVVSKFGKVGLYHPQKFSLLHTYCIDLSVPMHPHMSHRLSLMAKAKDNTPTPKCQRTHLVTDAVFLPDVLCVVFSTTKNILQWYDIGEIQMLNIGLDLFPRKEFMGLCDSSFAVPIPNKGHVECHRLFGLSSLPTCLEYWKCPMGKVLIGGVDGSITIIFITDPKNPLGRRKIRGKLHKVLLEEIANMGIVQYYKAHHHPVTDIYYIAERDLILSCSRDKKFSVFVKDVTDNNDSIIVSISKGVNTLAHCPSLKMIATGSDDFIVRLFSQFILKMPQMELIGHRSAVLSVAFTEINFMENAVLLSYSADSELRAWDPMTFICLQSLYPSFPVGSTILCKTPEFSRKSLLILLQNQSNEQQTQQEDEDGRSDRSDECSGETNKKKRVRIRVGSLDRGKRSELMKTKVKKQGSGSNTGSDNGTIILLYCNSIARIPIEKQGSSSRFPFDFDDFIQEFEELSMEYDKKLKEKFAPDFSNPSDDGNGEKSETEDVVHELGQTPPSKVKKINRISKEEVSEIESKLDAYVREIKELQRAIKDTQGSGKSLDSASADNLTGRLSTSSYGDVETPRRSGVNISVQAVDRFYEFQREKAAKVPRNLSRIISYGQAFNQHPLQELEPIEFSKTNLAIPERMKKALSIHSVSLVQELMQPETLTYLGIQTSISDRKSHKSKVGEKSQQSPKDGIGTETEQWKKKALSYTPPNSKFALFGRKMGNVYEEGDDDDDEDATF